MTTTGMPDLLAAMDRLYSPGGCPWDAEQTHESLVRYLLEESYELAEAIETGDRPGMREELGDVLLQVVFHARIAADDADDPFTFDDVARDLTDKLVRRHPHVFGDAPVEDLHAQWDAIKRTEKQRASVLDGIPAAQGALARAQKVVGRARRAGLPVGTTAVDEHERTSSGGRTDAAAYADELMELVRRAEADGVDLEGALRARIRETEAHVRERERTDAGRAAGPL
ncbi:XTP/dITP diphosphohydrolase [Paraoerskovia marina]|uniref:XTP/dITP diphosphohydrolase n=1 Tax=Paraoerskovia marina TaxID=545619 RepID=A0A1H1QHW8_9CELL|nr:MazG family protein [Paraoerskovia marina]SDS23060.1 XTP/dITP diphosphohydrolase [Paraoerskovia marina]